jgi:hypothetical protein
MPRRRSWLEEIAPNPMEVVIVPRYMIVTDLGQDRLARKDLVDAVLQNGIDVEEDGPIQRLLETACGLLGGEDAGDILPDVPFDALGEDEHRPSL